MFTTLTPIAQQERKLTPAELSEYESEIHQIDLMEREIGALELLDTALLNGADQSALLSVVNADGSLTALLGQDPIHLSLEELHEQVEEKTEEVKKSFWKKNKKAIVVGFTAAAAGIGAALVILTKLKRSPAATSGSDEHSTAEVPKEPLRLTAEKRDPKPSKDFLDRRNQSNLMEKTAKKALRPIYDEVMNMTYRAKQLGHYFDSETLENKNDDARRNALISAIRQSKTVHPTTDHEIESESHSFSRSIDSLEHGARELKAAIVSLESKKSAHPESSKIFDSVLHKELSTILKYASDLPAKLSKAKGLQIAVNSANKSIHGG